MSSKTEVIVLKDLAPPPAKGLRRRKPWTREDQEVSQNQRQALLDQIRGQRHQSRRRSPSSVIFGKSRALNRLFSRSANDVKDVTAESAGLKLASRKLAVSQICLHSNDDNFEVKFTKEGVRWAKTESLCDLSEIPSECFEHGKGDECKIVQLHPKPKIPEISEVPEPNDVEETKPRSPTVVLGPGPKILNRQLSKSANEIRKSGGGHYGLKVIGSQQIALSQIWTVPTNCGCCELGKDENCKRLKVEELRQKNSKEDVSPAKGKTSQISKESEPEKPNTLLTTTEEEDDDDDDSFMIVKMLTWMGRMLIKNPKPKPKWVVLQVPVVPRAGTTKNARGVFTKTSCLYLNVNVEAGSGLISITPVARFEELNKTCVFIKGKEQEEEEEKPKYTLGLYPEFAKGPLF